MEGTNNDPYDSHSTMNPIPNLSKSSLDVENVSSYSMDMDMLSAADDEGYKFYEFHDTSFWAKCTTYAKIWAFPPDVPPALQILRFENLALPMCYLLVGILQGLSGPLMNVYPLDLGATEAQQSTLSSLRSFPASFKLLFGFWSDNYKLFGYRRKSYMGLGWLISSLSMIVLLIFGFYLQQDNEDDDDDNNNQVSIPLLSVTYLMFGVGFWFAIEGRERTEKRKEGDG